MEYKYREISDIVRKLSQLDINPKKKRELIKASQGCMERLFGFPQELERAAKEAGEKNLKQDKAYEYLKEKMNKYENKIASQMVYQRNYPFGINNDYTYP
jgi:hypothetical protein